MQSIDYYKKYIKYKTKYKKLKNNLIVMNGGGDDVDIIMSVKDENGLQIINVIIIMIDEDDINGVSIYEKLEQSERLNNIVSPGKYYSYYRLFYRYIDDPPDKWWGIPRNDTEPFQVDTAQYQITVYKTFSEFSKYTVRKVY